MIVHLLLVGLLLVHAVTPTQTPPPKPSPTAPPAAGKKRFGPPAGTPGRSANIFVAISSEGAAPSTDAAAARAVVMAALTKRSVNVLDRNSLLGVAPNAGDEAIEKHPELLRLLDADGVLLVSLKIASRQGRRGPVGDKAAAPLVRSTVSLELRSVDGSTRARALGESESRDPAESARKAADLAFEHLLTVAEFGERQ